MNDLISIIMGVYNAENTLPQAIDSILNQTYLNWELIICDDGSTDNSFKIAQKYCEFKGHHIIVIKNDKNMGLGYSLNRCLERAIGSYIARMDADDISMPRRLEKEIEFLNDNPRYSIVSTAIIMFDDNREKYVPVTNSEPSVIDFMIGNPIAHPTCMIRRECLDAVGGYEESKRAIRVEDADLWIKFLENDYRFYIIPEPLYYWRFDYNSVKRQKLKYRLNGAILNCIGCKKLKLPYKYYLISFKPVIIGLIPASIRYKLHMIRTRR